MHEVGEAFDRRAGNERELVRCRARHGDVKGSWVAVKDWRCEPAFFGYFLCGGKESDCRPAQGQRKHRVGANADASERQKPTSDADKKTTLYTPHVVHSTYAPDPRHTDWSHPTHSQQARR